MPSSRPAAPAKGGARISGAAPPPRGSGRMAWPGGFAINNSSLCQALHERLSRQTTAVHDAASLSMALKSLTKESYCLIVVDLQISNLEKTEIIRILRITKHSPILAITEALRADEKVELFHAGVDVFIEKPVDIEVCIAQANALIELYLKTSDELKQSLPISFGSSLVIAPSYRQVLEAVPIG